MSTEQLEEIEELARRAIACKRWRWVPGMLAIMPEDRDGIARPERVSDDEWLPAMDSFPDLLDPATLGCLLALVREAWGPAASVSVNLSGFWAVGGATVLSGKGKGASINLGIWKLTELEALVAALEVAP